MDPIASMGLVYLPTFTIFYFTINKHPNVGKYTIHGWYGDGWNPVPIDTVSGISHGHDLFYEHFRWSELDRLYRRLGEDLLVPTDQTDLFMAKN